MLKYIRRGKKYIYSLDQQKFVHGNELRSHLDNGTPFEYTDPETGKNLIPGLRKGTRKNPPKVVDELLGPEEPLYKTKLYSCSNCGIMNKNRFRCTDCINLVDSNIEGDNIYYVW
jgi:hypothetical protein